MCTRYGGRCQICSGMARKVDADVSRRAAFVEHRNWTSPVNIEIEHLGIWTFEHRTVGLLNRWLQQNNFIWKLILANNSKERSEILSLKQRFNYHPPCTIARRTITEESVEWQCLNSKGSASEWPMAPISWTHRDIFWQARDPRTSRTRRLKAPLSSIFKIFGLKEHLQNFWSQRASSKLLSEKVQPGQSLQNPWGASCCVTITFLFAFLSYPTNRQCIKTAPLNGCPTGFYSAMVLLSRLFNRQFASRAAFWLFNRLMISSVQLRKWFRRWPPDL